MTESQSAKKQESAAETILRVEELVTEFRTEHGVVRALDHVSFEIPAGKTLGVVGESGCGKSVTALSIMQLIPIPPGEIVSGKVFYDGKDLLKMSESEMRDIRGNEISMIFQEPMTALNPVYTVGNQVGEAVRLHQGKSKKEAEQIAIEMFKKVGMPSPEERVRNYPHQMSGGMRQRVMIAMALACNPKLLIADEPTTALDVTIQAQILELLGDLQKETGMSVMLITHDLGVVAETCDEVVVMYAGRVVERASTEKLFSAPRHPYTAGLLKSVPTFDASAHSGGEKGKLQEIPGMVPSLYELPDGCKFQDRCSIVTELCREKEPELVSIGKRQVRCHTPLNVETSEGRI